MGSQYRIVSFTNVVSVVNQKHFNAKNSAFRRKGRRRAFGPNVKFCLYRLAQFLYKKFKKAVMQARSIRDYRYSNQMSYSLSGPSGFHSIDFRVHDFSAAYVN